MFFLHTYGSSGDANTTAQTMLRATDMSSGVFFDRYAAVEYAMKTTESYGILPLNRGIDDFGTFRMPEGTFIWWLRPSKIGTKIESVNYHNEPQFEHDSPVSLTERLYRVVLRRYEPPLDLLMLAGLAIPLVSFERLGVEVDDEAGNKILYIKIIQK